MFSLSLEYFQIEGLTEHYQLFKVEKYQQSSKERLLITIGRFMKDCVSYRGTILWKILSYKCTDQAIVTLPKSSKFQNFLRPLNLTCYQPRPLVLKMKVLFIFEIKLICFNVAWTVFQNAVKLYSVYKLVVMYYFICISYLSSALYTTPQASSFYTYRHFKHFNC